MQTSTPKSWPGGVATITLFVDDLDIAKQFYTNVFAIPVVYEDAACTVFKFENTLINLLKTSEAGELLEPAPIASREAGSRLLFTINVPDVDAIHADLVASGVTFLNGPINRPWGIRTISFFDPNGFLWEIASPIS